MNVALFNSNGLEIIRKTFKVGTDLTTAAVALYRAHYGTSGTVGAVMQRDYIGEYASVGRACKARLSK